MRLLIIVFLFASVASAQPSLTTTTNNISPLSYFSTEWESPLYQKANTAAGQDYMNDDEKEVIYILNLARMNPKLFAQTVVKAYPEYADPAIAKSKYFKSLVATMEKMEPLSVLSPDQGCFTSANCHAVSSGKNAYVGHERKSPACKKTEYYKGECCAYGFDDALDIVVRLLIDEGVPSLGHRVLMFYPFESIGVSIQPHKGFQYNAVLDFY